MKGVKSLVGSAEVRDCVDHQPVSPHFARMWDRGDRQAIACLAILAVLAKLVLVAFCSVPPTAGAASQSDFGSLVICTVHGPMSQAGGGDPTPDPTRSASDHCGACTLAQTVALLFVAALLTASLTHVPPVRWQPTRARLLPDHLGIGGIRSRAPPLPA
jgi:hypothetical protein